MSNWCFSSSAIMPAVTEPNILPSSPALTLMTQMSLDNALGEFGHGVELVRFALGAALLERLDAALVGLRERNGQALREQIIARVAGGDFDLVGFAAEADDVVGKNDFSFHEIRKMVET